MPTDRTAKPQSAGSGDEQRHTILEEHGYRVVKTLGQGSYATVKMAYSDRHQTNVAVKIISKRDAPGEYLEKFLPREISIVKLLKHSNLVIFLQVGWALRPLTPIPWGSENGCEVLDSSDPHESLLKEI